MEIINVENNYYIRKVNEAMYTEFPGGQHHNGTTFILMD